MLVNSGALFTLLSFVEKLFVSDKFSTLAQNIFFASSLFLGGIACAILCAYVAYVNYIHLVQLSYVVSYRDQAELRYPSGLVYEDRIQGWLNRTREKLDEQIKEHKYWIKLTLWGGNLFGICSGALFLAGCFYTRSALLLSQ